MTKSTSFQTKSHIKKACFFCKEYFWGLVGWLTGHCISILRPKRKTKDGNETSPGRNHRTFGENSPFVCFCCFTIWKQGCRFVPCTFSETKPQMVPTDLNPPAPVGAKGHVFPEALAIGSFS